MRTLALAPVVFALIVLPAQAWSDPTACEQMVAATEAIDRHVVLLADLNSVDDVTRRSFRVDPLSNHAIEGEFLDINRFTNRLGQNQIARDHFRCDGDTLGLERMEWLEGRAGAETFDPPLPWLVWPLASGAEWDWEGTIGLGPAAPTMNARATFTVDAAVTLDVADTTFTLATITYVLTVAPSTGGDAQVIRTTSVNVVAPWYAVLYRERWLGEVAVEPVQRFVLAP